MTSGDEAQERRDERAVRRMLIAAMALGFAALIAAGVAAWTSTRRTQVYSDLVDHTFEVREALNRMQVTLEQSETARRGFLLIGDRAFDDGYRLNAAALLPEIDRIARMTADNPRQIGSIAKLRRNVIALNQERDASMARARTGDRMRAFAPLDRNRAAMRMQAVRARLDAMRAEEGRLLEARSVDQERSAATFLLTLAIAGVVLVLLALVSLLTVRRYTTDLGKSHASLAALNESLEDAVEERTADLARANDEIQRFAYIVSHDLRSPLVNVMGFTSELEAGNQALAKLVDRVEQEAPALLTAEARDAARGDLPEAIGFIRTSTAKMDRLINAILQLSRQGRRVITPEPLGMDRIVETIGRTLQHLLDERGARLEIEGTLPSIVSDRLAIEQLFGNLIDNAIKYLDPSRPGVITVRGRVEGQRAIYEVADNGRGIAPADHARIFDLFRRSGPQDQPGEGIGLATVRALTYRLGGLIDVASDLGKGATFRINLPLRHIEPTGT